MFGNKKLKAEIKSLKSDLDRDRQDTFMIAKLECPSLIGVRVCQWNIS